MLAAGARLGPYEVLGLLGAGGMGEVYRARDTRLGRAVAVKVLPASVAEDEGRRLRFEEEARAAGALNHPNVLAVYDVGRENGVLYVVSELLEGQTLRDRLDGPLPIRKATDYAIQIAQGLAAAHGKGIVHRDLKDAAICVDAPSVSRRHARVVFSEGRATIEDMHSKNGTSVNGLRIEGPVTLSDGDEIRVGVALLVVRAWADGSTATGSG